MAKIHNKLLHRKNYSLALTFSAEQGVITLWLPAWLSIHHHGKGNCSNGRKFISFYNVT
jgi:hypothetical protein